MKLTEGSFMDLNASIYYRKKLKRKNAKQIFVVVMFEEEASSIEF